MGHDLGFGHGFLGHFLPPVGWNLKPDSGSILEADSRIKQEN
jgi:hypothetical protein